MKSWNYLNCPTTISSIWTQNIASFVKSAAKIRLLISRGTGFEAQDASMRHRGCPSQRDYRRRWLSFEWERKTVRYRFDSCYLSNKQSAERTQWGRRVPVWQDGNTLRKHVRHRIRSWLWVNGHRESSSGGNTPLARRSACAAETKERTSSCQGNETLFVVSPLRRQD